MQETQGVCVGLFAVVPVVDQSDSDGCAVAFSLAEGVSARLIVYYDRSLMLASDSSRSRVAGDRRRDHRDTRQAGVSTGSVRRFVVPSILPRPGDLL